MIRFYILFVSIHLSVFLCVCRYVFVDIPLFVSLNSFKCFFLCMWSVFVHVRLFVCLFVSAVYFVNGGPPSQLHDGSTRVSPSKTQRQGSPEEARTTLNPPYSAPKGFRGKRHQPRALWYFLRLPKWLKAARITDKNVYKQQKNFTVPTCEDLHFSLTSQV